MKDNRGTELKVGQKVAYNLSGEIAHGIIVSLDEKFKNDRWGKLHDDRISIELTCSLSGFHKGHISKITSEKNVLVLLDKEY